MKYLKILLVDDDVLFFDIAAAVLDEAFPGALVVKLSQPCDIANVVKSGEFDCLIVDYAMPSVDGITVARAVSAKLPYLPIILITGAGDEEIAVLALRSGVSDYLSKAKLNAVSMGRAIKLAIELCRQRRVIDVQREELEMFAHALAHDFKQPLRQITTFSRLIADELDSNGSVAVHNHLRFMRKAAGRLTRLVDVMSEYTLLHRSLSRSRISVRKVVTAAISALSDTIRSSNGVVINRADGQMFANPTMMTYVIQNLIVNGLKYNASESPRIEIHARQIDLRCEISISDNGIGVEHDQREAIFAPLVRLHTQGEYPGTGLGLTLARRALANQLGTIVCEPGRGGGSRFVVTMPCDPELPGQDVPAIVA